MARKVFISVLGTGFYVECVYKMGEFTSDTTRFIQRATLQTLTQQNVGGEWTKNDQIYIVLTEKAKADNWEVSSGTRHNPKTGKEETYIGLKSVLERMSLPTPIRTIDIPDGNNEKELWEIFDKIYTVLEDGDELYFDLTHGFRYLPMLVLVLGNYAKFLKHTEVKSITYGSYEARDTKTNIAPIIDITPLAALQDWTNAAADYLEHGDAEELYSLAQDKLYYFLRNPSENSLKAQILNNLCRNINNYCNNLSFCRGIPIVAGKECVQIKSLIEKATSDFIVPLHPLFNEIQQSVNECAKNSSANMIHAAELCAKQGNYQQAVTFLREGIISIICSRHGIDLKDHDRREIVKEAVLKHLHKDTAEKKKKENTQKKELTYQEREDIIASVNQDSLLTNDTAQLFYDILDYRNDFNHAGMRSNNKKAFSMQEAIWNLISRSKVFLEGSQQHEFQSHPFLLINLSNHPYENWSVEQKEAAKEYGEVRDMPFPAINPDDDTEQIRERADEYISKIIKLNAEYAVTVHLMGEMSFVVYAVSRLSERGIRCICSTSERDTEDLGGGEKKVTFRFKRFRDYDC